MVSGHYKLTHGKFERAGHSPSGTAEAAAFTPHYTRGVGRGAGARLYFLGAALDQFPFDFWPFRGIG